MKGIYGARKFSCPWAHNSFLFLLKSLRVLNTLSREFIMWFLSKEVYQGYGLLSLPKINLLMLKQEEAAAYTVTIIP